MLVMSRPRTSWKVLFVHPSPLMYSEVYLRLEPLGLELVAEACRRSGYAVRLLDLQVWKHKDYFQTVEEWRPDAIGFSLNYLANVPEVIDLAKATRTRWPDAFVFVGGHSASFVAKEILEHAEGAIDCVVRGEGEAIAPRLLAVAEESRGRIGQLPGVSAVNETGPAPEL